MPDDSPSPTILRPFADAAEAAASAVVGELAIRDAARDAADGYRGPADAHGAVRRLRASAAAAGDTATVTAIDTLGKRRAAEVYATTRVAPPEPCLRWDTSSPPSIGWVLHYQAAGEPRRASVVGEYDDTPDELATAIGWLGLDVTGRVNVYRDGASLYAVLMLDAGKPAVP